MQHIGSLDKVKDKYFKLLNNFCSDKSISNNSCLER